SPARPPAARHRREPRVRPSPPTYDPQTAEPPSHSRGRASGASWLASVSPSASGNLFLPKGGRSTPPASRFSLPLADEASTGSCLGGCWATQPGPWQRSSGPSSRVRSFFELDQMGETRDLEHLAGLCPRGADDDGPTLRSQSPVGTEHRRDALGVDELDRRHVQHHFSLPRPD